MDKPKYKVGDVVKSNFYNLEGKSLLIDEVYEPIEPKYRVIFPHSNSMTIKESEIEETIAHH